MTDALASRPNADLAVGPDRRPHWNSPAERRRGFHDFHRISRYGASFRAARTLDLRLSADLAIAARDDVRQLTTTPWFSAMAVTEGNRLLFESYAPDFGPTRPHAIMSISKMAMNLLIGRLWEEGKVGLDERVGAILPDIGPGYAEARIADVLNMNVLNGYDEDYSNTEAAVFRHEAASGGRLPEGPEQTNRAFLKTIGLSPGTTSTDNPTGQALYKSANTDVVALVAEARGARSLTACAADLADAMGAEGVLHIATDRTGMPLFSGGISLTARDLCRYGALFARGGRGIDGQPFGSAAFLKETQAGGVPLAPPRAHLRYSNQTNTDGSWLGHGGYGGQYLVANPETGRTACYLSVMQNEAGYDPTYYPPIITMLAALCAGD